MSREELMKQTKEYIITLFLKCDEGNQRLKEENENLRREIDSKKVDEHLHKDYLEMKKELELTKELNNRNEFIINELQQLLDRYKHIVDRLGGETI